MTFKKFVKMTYTKKKVNNNIERLRDSKVRFRNLQARLPVELLKVGQKFSALKVVA